MKALCILMMLFVLVVPVMAQPSLSLAYTQSLTNDSNGLIGKASVSLFEVKLPVPNTKLTFSTDFLAIPDGDTLEAGLGGSVTVQTNLMGINIGIGYVPRRYGWSWNVSLLEFKL